MNETKATVGAMTAGAALVLSVLAGSAIADIPYRTVVLEGEPAPSGGVFGVFSPPEMGAEGSIALSASVDGVPSGVDSRLFLEREGVISLLATEGMMAPGAAAGQTFGAGLQNLLQSVFTPDGAYFFRTLLEGDGVTPSNNMGLWVEGPSALGLVFRKGDDLSLAVPLTSAGEFISAPIDADRAVVRVELEPEPGGSDGRAILLVENGAISAVLRQDAQAPSLPAGVLNSSVPNIFCVSAAGDFMGEAVLEGAGVNSLNDGVLWGGTVYDPQVLLREGTAVSNSAGASTFQRFDAVALSRGGTRAMEVQVQGGELAGVSIWVFEGTEPVFVMNNATTPVPGAGPDVSFGAVTLLGVDDGGTVVFSAVLQGPGVAGSDNSGVFRASVDGGVEVIAREGDPAPGVDDAFWSDLTSAELRLSALGQFVLEHTLTGPGVTNVNDRGLWLSDSSGELQLVVREGDEFDIDDDPDVTTLRLVEMLDSGESVPSDAGEIAFRLQYEPSGSGIFVAQLDPPGSESCPGDADGDGQVNLADLNLVLANFGIASDLGDVTGDGIVNLADLNAVLAAFGTMCD